MNRIQENVSTVSMEPPPGETLGQSGGVLYKKVLWDAYQDHCMSTKQTPLGVRAAGKLICQLFPSTRATKVRVGGQPTAAYKGWYKPYMLKNIFC